MKWFSVSNFLPPKECILCRGAKGVGAARCMGGGGEEELKYRLWVNSNDAWTAVVFTQENRYVPGTLKTYKPL